MEMCQIGREYLEMPVVKKIAAAREIAWVNPGLVPWEEALSRLGIGGEDIDDAQERLKRFAPFILKCFPETKDRGGIIESDLAVIPSMKEYLNHLCKGAVSGSLLLKKDSHLAVAGSVKARGGIYEVLKHTEELAVSAGLLTQQDDYSKLASDACREFFSQYTIQVGSTGNLGLSIGIASAAVGYRVVVHMSADAKQWKKDMLKSHGVTVVEYASDYSEAVKNGRRESDADPKSYFVDDENSRNLFMGYAVAARRLRLKELWGDHVHVFFVEPTQAPCMVLGMATGLHSGICVQDVGLTGQTHADGLAVGRPSGFVGKVMEPLLSGEFTVDDWRLYEYMRALLRTEDIFIEPSACAAFEGPLKLLQSEETRKYLEERGLMGRLGEASHIVWATGGSLVPEDERKAYENTILKP